MNVWLFKDGESLPIEKNERRMRMGMLGNSLALMGYSVTWFSSTFIHSKKKLIENKDKDYIISNNYLLKLVHAGNGFKSNISLTRYLFYRRYAKKLNKIIESIDPPDIIVCAFPLIDVAYNIVRYANKNKIPIIIDIRDLWPETIVKSFPKFLNSIVKYILKNDFKMTKYVMSNANSLCAMSSGVLRWGVNYSSRNQNSNDIVIPIGYSTKSYNPTKLNINTISINFESLKHKKIFTYVGTFGHTYDLELILKVAQELNKKDTEILFVLAGIGPKLDNLKNKYGKLENVYFTGWLNNKIVKDLLKNSYAGLLPWDSIDNAMPNKFFDYISNKLPVISSAKGELNNIIEKEEIGCVYDKKNSKQLKKCILNMVKHPRLNIKYKKNAYILYKFQYSEDVLYKQYSQHVENIFNLSKII